MEPLLILVLRKGNPFNFSPLARSSFLNAFSLEFAQGAELVLLWTLNDWPKDLHEEAEINYSFRGFFPLVSVILCLEARLHPALPAGWGWCKGWEVGARGGVGGRQAGRCLHLVSASWVQAKQPASLPLFPSSDRGQLHTQPPSGKLLGEVCFQVLQISYLEKWGERKSVLRVHGPLGVNPGFYF